MDCFGASALLLVCCYGFLLFPIHQLKNATAWLLQVRLTPPKVCNVLAYTRQPCFSAHLGGGMVHFSTASLLLVLLLLIFVVPIRQPKMELLGFYWSD